MVSAMLKGSIGGHSNTGEQASFHLAGEKGKQTSWRKGCLSHTVKDVQHAYITPEKRVQYI